MSEAHRKVQLHCSGIGRNADDWAVLLVSVLDGELPLQICWKDPSQDVGL